ncbi:MAG TPA: carboxypeptidase-like regulatory domain-containing protein [Daejeonella sp.]|nr:carboxypeptidase-like regulatory domain-containing protein [Daejeonella sp.]
MMRYLYCLLLISLLPWYKVQGQVAPKLISGSYQNTPFNQFIQDIEKQSGYYFYYDIAGTDSLTISLQVVNQPLQIVLDLALKETSLKYSMDWQKRVFITSGSKIQVGLPLGFFRPETGTGQKNESFLAGFSDQNEKEIVASTLENKVYEIGIKSQANQPGNANLAGYVREAKTGEAVIGAILYIENPRIQTITDQFGYFSLSLPRGRHSLQIKSMGMRNAKRQILLYSNGKLDIELTDQVIALKEVVIEAEKAANVNRTQMGLEKVNIKTIKQVPSVFGEADVLRVVLTLPGVQSVGEASTGFNVRGGSADQNLVLLNDATIYNSSHMFGFFSAFNPDVVKEVELYKSSIPSKYGGRLSSVLDISTREGNKKKFSGSGGLGLLTSRLTLEGPILGEKTSFLLGGRSTYSDALLQMLPEDKFKNSKASFYDLNLHVTHKFNSKNDLYLTGYSSRDRFNLLSDTLYSYQNRNFSARWKHMFNDKFYGVFTAGSDDYGYSISSDKNPVNAYLLGFNLSQHNLKADFNYYLNAKHTLDFGWSSIYYGLKPGFIEPRGAVSLIKREKVRNEQALESALYIGDRYEVSSRLSLNFGLRYSVFSYLGPQKVYRYLDGYPKEEVNIRDTLSYESGTFIKTYHAPEFRLAARYSLTANTSVKAGFNTLRQNIHMLSNTASSSPSDVWKLSDPNIAPQSGSQVSLGLYRNFKSNTIETSVEAYYKNLKDYLDYKSSAVLIMNDHIETDVITTRGKAYGLEAMVKKLTGKMNGWISYTYSRTFLRMQNISEGELINQGKFYPANYDKPHDLTLVGNYRFSHRFSTSLNFTYSTGRPITVPIAKYQMGGSDRVFYSDRNAFRIPDYYRGDFSMNIEGNHKIKKLAHSSWTLGVYNITGRRNAYSTYFVTEKGMVKGYKLSVFGQPIPFVTYNFKF